MSAGTVTIYIVPAREKNWEGDPTGTQDGAVEIKGCKKWPDDGVEDSTRGEDVLARMNVWLPPRSATVSALDSVLLGGSIWRVVGPPKAYESGRGVDKGTIIRLAKRGTRT